MSTPFMVQYATPQLSLQGFRRVSLSASNVVSLSFTIDAWAMSVTDPDGDRVVNPGKYMNDSGVMPMLSRN